MGILEEISRLQDQGMDSKEISSRLQERGITPKAIEDAINQMKIKDAIYSEEEEKKPNIKENLQGRNQTSPPTLHVPKSMEIENGPEELYAPPAIEETEVPQYGEQYNEEYSPQQGYEESGGGGYETDTFIEIAEQVFSEKIKKERKQIDALNEFATLAETKISNNHERLKRMENIIDKLQIAIIEKIGSYGKNLESIKDEMEMMQDSFEKIVPKLHEINSKNTRHSKTTHRKKKKS
ncbi:MAG: hypothetical protein ABIE36_02685 [Candidatus Diapherotrites archaeon]